MYCKIIHRVSGSYVISYDCIICLVWWRKTKRVTASLSIKRKTSDWHSSCHRQTSISPASRRWSNNTNKNNARNNKRKSEEKGFVNIVATYCWGIPFLIYRKDSQAPWVPPQGQWLVRSYKLSTIHRISSDLIMS